ncbi:DNA primase [Rhodothermus profundi]|uniref:DNA primase n=1 Tax=Rhodothermus profundi TaxID=633813 RepID=A0A1M6PAT1_9BACT|nr:DNA primase [Rhodothermus profundi]SHK05038.1 DNA primase [Rhodothermus profundi]
MRIPEATIEAIRAAIDIVEVVGEYVSLRRRGSNWFGLCPFHEEKTPSFSVNPTLGIFKCFGCGVGGDVFAFIQQIERVSFVEAVRLLAERAGIPLPDGEEDTHDLRPALYHALRFAARFYFEQLSHPEIGQVARAYLKQRGIRPEAVRRFGLGYAPDAWDALLKAATQAGIQPEVLEQAGLVLPRKERTGYYDRFRHRLMFPIFSHTGRVVGFGGRLLTPHPDQPKYINTPETPVYHKGRTLYGLYQARQALRAQGEAILVEGYTDVIALHQAGIEHVVATSGTALTPDQARLLARYVRRVVLLYDADAAGQQAALRSIELFLARGLSVYVVSLPPGEDPDSFVRAQGARAFQEYLQRHRRDFVTFHYELARRQGQLDTPEGEAEVARTIVEAIARLPDPLLREPYVRRAAELLKIPPVRLLEILQATETAPAREAPSPRSTSVSLPPQPPPVWHEAERLLVRLMLEEGRPMIAFVLGHMALEEFTEGPPRQLITRLLEQYETGAVDARPFLEGRYGPELQRLATEALMEPYEPSENWARKGIPVPRLRDRAYEAAADAMMRLKLQRIDELIHQLKEEQLRAQHNEARLREIIARLNHILQLRRQIERRAFLNPELLPRP